MVQRVNGAALPGVWVERKVTFVKVTFSKDISALAAADLVTLDTGVAAGAGTVANSSFGVVNGALTQALNTLATKSTILGISNYDAASRSVDVMLGHAEGWFSDANGLIGSALPLTGTQAVVTTAGAAPTDTLGQVVALAAGAVTFSLYFSTLDGKMTVATAANGALTLGPGATSGAVPVASATGTAGYYPGTI